MGDRARGTCAVCQSTSLPLTLLLLALLAPSCAGSDSGQPLLTAEMPLHLEDHLGAAVVEGARVSGELIQPVEWDFSEPQPDWWPVDPVNPEWKAVEPVRVDDALRLPLTTGNAVDGGRLIGAICVDLPDWNLDDWGFVEIRARTSDPMRIVGMGLNYTGENPVGAAPFSFYSPGDRALLVTDGTAQTYRLSLDWPGVRRWEGPWTHLAIWFNARDGEHTGTLDILSVRVIPRHAEFAGDDTGVREVRGGPYAGRGPVRRTLYMHAPGKIAYRVTIPEDARLDAGLGVVRHDAPVTFAITARPPNGQVETLLEETYADRDHWGQRSVDLSHLAGQTVSLSLEARSDLAGTVALWGAPTLSGPRATDKPNVIFYIIDGAGAGDMSVYGYNRRTTPNLERLAAEGAVFDTAFSNSAWTKISNPSFMTSLHHSVLGGFRSGSDPLPEQAVTMAQHMHRAGYQTGVFVSNSYAGTLTSFERGVDVLREDQVVNATSSKKLHEKYWEWRASYPSEPYWVHFQTTDVHGPTRNPGAPFEGLFVSPTQRALFDEWTTRRRSIGTYPFTDDEVWERTGISRQEYANVRRGLYDETMAHNDYQIGQLVNRLKSAGEWNDTLLIVAADHGHEHAARAQLDPLPPKYGSPIFANFTSRIPMIFIWPAKIPPGQRISHPVSMIDMLPTILDLADLPMPEMMQGQSLAPLLLGERGWEPRPVIFDEFYVDHQTGELRGKIEVVDGQWGASLGIGLSDEPFWYDPPPTERRPSPLLLYDIWSDPYCLVPVNDKHPDLVEKYSRFLGERWRAHQAMAEHFSRSADSPLTPEQLRTLRALGYIQ